MLTQRLIGLGLKPGEMVRVLAHHLIESGMVPDDIQPYCSTVDLAREGTRESRVISSRIFYGCNITHWIFFSYFVTF